MVKQIRFTILLLSVVILCIGALTPVFAQGERVELNDTFSVIPPDGWKEDSRSRDGVYFINGDSSILFIDPERLLKHTKEDESPVKVAIALFDSLYSFKIKESSFETEEFNGAPSAQWYYTYTDQKNISGVFIVAQMPDGRYFAMDVLGTDDTSKDDYKAARAFGRSLRDVAALVTTGEACTVSTDVEKGATLRVGPGFNRGTVAFLETGVEFNVLGQGTDDEGNLWFKLDKEEAAPKKSANEVWVISTQVQTTGDCATVASAEAPPIIAGLSGGGGSGGASVSFSGMGGSGWTLNFSRTSNASCGGVVGNFQLSTGDLWSNWSEAKYSQSVSVVFNSSTTFTVGGELRFVKQANGIYAATWGNAGSNTQMYATVISNRQINGQMVGNISDGTVSCSGTTDFSLTKN